MKHFFENRRCPFGLTDNIGQRMKKFSLCGELFYTELVELLIPCCRQNYSNPVPAGVLIRFTPVPCLIIVDTNGQFNIT